MPQQSMRSASGRGSHKRQNHRANLSSDQSTLRHSDKPRTVGTLRPRQKRFVLEYLADHSAAAAAYRAGYSRRSARIQGPRLLSNAAVANEIDIRQSDILEKLEISAERVVRELATIAFSNVADFISVDSRGAISYSCNFDGRAVAAIEKIATKPGPKSAQRIAIKLHDKVRSLAMLGRYLGIFKEGRQEGRRRDPAELLNAMAADLQCARRDE